MSVSALLSANWYWFLVGAIFLLLILVIAYANLPSSWILPSELATEPFLSTAKLQVIPGTELVNPRSIWAETGAVVMAVRRPG